jgi:hypothetical protein
MIGEHLYRPGLILGNSSCSKLVEVPRESEANSAVQFSRVFATA